MVNVWDLRDYSLHRTVPVFEAIETVLVVPEGSDLPGSKTETSANAHSTALTSKKSGQAPVKFLTVGEGGIVQVWQSEG